MTILGQRLRERITFERQVVDQDSNGDTTIAWETAALDSDTDLEDVPAEVLTGPGREMLAAEVVQGEIVARINLRWFPGLDHAWRIVHGDRVYNIRSIETDVTGRREYRLRCTAGVNDGQ
jgi:head-tail adaptor